MSLRGYKPKTAKAAWMMMVTKVDKKTGAITGIKLLRKKDQYRVEAREFVQRQKYDGKVCPVVTAIASLRNGRKYGHPISAELNEVHHIRGRGYGGRGPLLMDKRFWVAVSKQGHRWIHSHPTEARLYGWLPPVGEYNKPVPEIAQVFRNELQGISEIIYETPVIPRDLTVKGV